jgi:voltage-gated potassium channel
MAQRELGKPAEGWRRKWYVIIFEADTRAGKVFDVLLIVAIVASVLAVILDSVESLSIQYGTVFRGLEWFFTLLFTLEYAVRLTVVRHPARYAASFFGAIDLLAILPTYLSLFLGPTQHLLNIRALRLLRIFRVFKLSPYLAEGGILASALVASRRKIVVFLTLVLTLVLILATLMYVVEGPANGFTSIPTSAYWAIVTLTTVGYGDISPKTPLGQAIASVVMIIGYGILAVPTGIVTAELTSRAIQRSPTTRTCSNCLTEGLDEDAVFCKCCGHQLAPYSHD